MDAQDEPVFEIPEETASLGTVDQVVQQRTDIKLANLQVFAAQRIVSDSWKDWLPSVNGPLPAALPGPRVRSSRPEQAGAPILRSASPSSTPARAAARRRSGRRSLQQSRGALSGQVREARIRGAPLLRVGAPQRARAPEFAVPRRSRRRRCSTSRTSASARARRRTSTSSTRSAARATRIRRSRLRKTPSASRGWTCSLRWAGSRNGVRRC